MKRQTILAFDMLEKEMECIATEELLIYKGGTGEGDYGSGMWLVTGSGVWDMDPYSSGFYSSGDGYYGSGDYGSGDYGSGSSGSGVPPEDPRQTMDNYVDANGGWENWSGGFVSGVGYVGPTTTITGSSGNGVMDGFETAFSSMATAYGLTSAHIDAITELVDNNQWATFSFKTEGNLVKIIGHTAGIADVVLNAFEITQEEVGSWAMWEDVGQIALGVLCIGTGGVGGLVLGAGLATWELYEHYVEEN